MVVPFTADRASVVLRKRRSAARVIGLQSHRQKASLRLQSSLSPRPRIFAAHGEPATPAELEEHAAFDPKRTFTAAASSLGEFVKEEIDRRNLGVPGDDKRIFIYAIKHEKTPKP